MTSTDRSETPVDLPLERCTVCGEGVMDVPRFVCDICREQFEHPQNVHDRQALDDDWIDA